MGKLGSGCDGQFGLDVFDMRLDGLDAQVQVPGDFAGAIALTDPAEYLQLAVAERLDWRIAFQCLPVKEFVGKLRLSLSLI